jgi:hypothetical protein
LKIFQVVITYLEPTEAVITLYAQTEEEAINLVRKQISPSLGTIEIKEVEELHDLPSIDADDMDPNRKVN